MSDDTEFNTDGIQALLKALKNPPVGRVGILGGGPRSSAAGSGLTNAEIGAIHEFGAEEKKKKSFLALIGARRELGTTKLPVRSWLRLPVEAILPKRIASSSAFTDESKLKEMIRTKSAAGIVRLLCIMAEAVVHEGFQTGGFGTWIPSNMARKKVKMTLIETGQLRGAVTSDIVEGSGS